MAEAQFALHLRGTLGLMVHASVLAFFALLAGHQNRFVFRASVVCFLVLAVLNMVFPLHRTVLSLDKVSLPGGGVGTFPVTAPGAWWMQLIYAGILAIYVYGIVVALRIWSCDRVGSVLVGLAASASLLAMGTGSLIDVARVKAPYVGTFPFSIFVVCMAIFLSRSYADRGRQVTTSERQFASAFEYAAIGMALVAPDGRWLKVNQSLCQMLGYTAGELRSKTFQDITHPEDLAKDLDFVRRILAGEIDTYQMEKRYFHKEGHLVWILLSVSLVRDEQGQPVHFISQIQDITERMRAQEELRANEERFRLLIEQTTDIITVVNNEGIIRFVSPSVKQYLGYEPSELLNRNSLALVDPQDVERVSAAIQKVLADPSATASVEYRFRHRDGSWRIIESIGRNIPNQAPDAFIVVNSRDITESRQLSEQLRQAQKMEAIGTLAGGIAHDFNNMLTVINGRSELLLRRMNSEPISREIGLILQTGKRAANLTRQLLAFGRRQLLEPKVIDLNQIVNDLCKMLHRLVPENVVINTVLAENLQFTKADPGQIEQVLMNLVVNARDAMPSGGQVTIETSNIEYHESAAQSEIPVGRYVVLKVNDNGCGMDEHVKAHLFEPFFTTKERGKGTGLGLATVFGIVKQSNGHIRVESERGKGTTFWIYLPAHSGGKACISSLQTAVRMGEGQTVLVVEDEDLVRNVAREVLESNGYSVLESANGEECLQLYNQHRDRVNLVLTDAVMPKMSGVELATQLRQIQPKIKLLLMSGYTDSKVAEDCASAQGSGFIQKPFTADALLRKVSEVLTN